MTDNEKITQSKRSKIILAIAIIIAILIILSSIYIWYEPHPESKENDMDEIIQLEFSIDIVDCPYDLGNKSFYYQLKNVSDNTFNYTVPEIGKNLNFYITAANGTRYSYAGPVTMGLPHWRNLSSNEIEEGYIWFGFKIFYLYASAMNYTHWQNWTKDESWFFQPGTYEIYGEYKSRPNEYLNDVLIGVWHSNVITLTIE